MRYKVKNIGYLIVTLFFVMASCRDVEIVVPTEYEIVPIGENPNSDPLGLYILNEGAYNQNSEGATKKTNASIDYLDYRTGLYARNIYSEANPSLQNLGESGIDIQIYRGKLYTILNDSHRLEIMNASTRESIKRISIENPRYIRFYRDFAYVTAYDCPISIDPMAPTGSVYKIDVNTLEIVDRIDVGYQPEEFDIINENIYVANSGIYRMPDFDKRVSVIQMDGFKMLSMIPVGVNLHRVKADQYGKLWVSSRGNYEGLPSALFVLNKKNPNSSEYVVTDTISVECSEMVMSGDSLYTYFSEYNSFTDSYDVSYSIIDLVTKNRVATRIITDGTASDIKNPSGIIIHPETKDIYIADAKNGISSGMIYCYDRYGKRKWSVRTGVNPGKMVFLTKRNIQQR